MLKNEEELTCLDVLENTEAHLLVVQNLNEIMIENCFCDNIDVLDVTKARRMLTIAKALSHAIGEMLSVQMESIKDRICKEYEEGSNENE